MHVIMTQKRDHQDWIAYFEDDHGAWEAGSSEAEAIGKLAISNPTTFNLKITPVALTSDQN